MTAKRFKCHLGVVGVHIGVGTDEHELTGDECRDLLNKLSEENEQLRHDATILIQSNQDYRKENEQLKAQLLYAGDGVCNICKHQCLVKSGKYFVARCKKEHEECSKVDLQYCEDFEKELN